MQDEAPLTLSLGSLLMVFSGLRTRNTRRDLMVLMSRPLLFLDRKAERKCHSAAQNHILDTESAVFHIQTWRYLKER